MMSFDEIRQAALELPFDLRAELIESLIASLTPETDSPCSEEWLLEIERRSVEIDAGTAKHTPWDEVQRRAFRFDRND